MRIFNQDELEVIHESCYKHRNQIKSLDQRCGCFYCELFFTAKDIESWTDDKQTALCPNCDIDSVLIESEFVSITPYLLRQMHLKYFNWESKL